MKVTHDSQSKGKGLFDVSAGFTFSIAVWYAEWQHSMGEDLILRGQMEFILRHQFQ